jgi:beta-lactamase regulating signal transducer with metallopeptidase domain
MTIPNNLWLHAAALHLWQATLFGLVIALVIMWLPVLPARLRHFAGCLALLRFMLPACLFASLVGSLHLFAAGGSWLPSRLGALWLPPFIVSGNARETPWATVLHLPDAGVLTTIWALGAILLLGMGMTQLVLGRRAVKRGQVPFSAKDQEHLETLAGRVGLRPGRVTGYYVPSSGWLGVVGLFRSRVIVPEGLFSALEDREVDSVLLHELMHVKRHDNLLRLCQSGVVAIFWFHPLVWWLDRRLRWESERACDEGVLRLTGANRVYASGLFKAMRFALGLNLPGVSGMSRLRLQTRIQAVLNHQNRKDSPVKLTLTVSTLVGLFGLATLMASAPAASDGTGAPAAQNQAAENPGGKSQPAPADSPATTAPGSKVFNISELDQMPVARSELAVPVYPAALRKAGLAGEAIIGFVVDEQGNVGDVRVVPPKDPKDIRTMKVGDVEVTLTNDERFDQAAMDAVRQWKFSPGKKGGKPVKVLMSVPIVFSFSP